MNRESQRLLSSVDTALGILKDSSDPRVEKVREMRELFHRAEVLDAEMEALEAQLQQREAESTEIHERLKKVVASLTGAH